MDIDRIDASIGDEHLLSIKERQSLGHKKAGVAVFDQDQTAADQVLEAEVIHKVKRHQRFFCRNPLIAG